MTNNRANIAFLGSRDDIWHRLGQEMSEGMSIEQWAAAAGLAWHAVKVPAIAALHGEAWDHIEPSKRFMRVDGMNHVCRSDNGHPLGYVSDGYQTVQPSDVLAWFEQYIGVDERFELDCAGSLKQGEIIWATATYKDALSIVGERFKARLLMTTTFDGSGSTINKGTMTRVVCNNTLDAALADKGAGTIRTRHNTRFNPERVGRELAQIAEGFTHFRAMAEAMVAVNMSREATSQFFKTLLDIPFDAKREDISGRKLNTFQALSNAHAETVREGTQGNTAWAALNAITRYVDHDKSTRGGDSKEEARVLSANFGSGAALKAKAVGLLLPDFRVPELVAA
jgi:phage/plasmid-like protein (TIGR03299 family)